MKALADTLPTGVEITLNGRPLDERVGAALFDPRWQSLWAYTLPKKVLISKGSERSSNWEGLPDILVHD